MAFEPFNVIGGLTIGIPPIPVINENGVATLNGLQVTGLSNLGSVSNVRIFGGNNGYFLQTDGAGGLTWAPSNTSGNGNGIPGGANSQVQFNDSGNFGGDAGFTYDKVGNILTVTGNIVAYNLNSSGNVNSNIFIGNVINVANVNATKISATGNVSAGNANLGNLVTANFYQGNGFLLSGVTANFANTAGFVTSNSQPNITSLGILSNLSVNGISQFGNLSNVKITGGVSGQVITTDGTGNLSFQSAPAAVTATYVTANYQPNITSLGNLTSLTVQGISNLGPAGNVIISGGNVGYILSTNGSGNLSWVPQANGGGIGGSNTQIQFNDDGNFAGSPYLTWDNANLAMQVAGNFTANSVQMGAGSFKWSKSFVYFASTASSALNQTIYSIPTSNVSGIEFEIMATEPAGPSRQFCKISSIYYNGSVQYNEYATLIINGGVGNFGVDYNPGNIIAAPSLELKVSPSSANPITYKMLITVFAE